MTKVNQNFAMWQGENKRIEAPVKDSDGNALTLNGATITWRLYRSVNDTEEALIEKTTPDGITIINKDATNDGVRITLAKADTQNIEPGQYYHECRIADSSGNEEVVFTGTIVLNRSKTL